MFKKTDSNTKEIQKETKKPLSHEEIKRKSLQLAAELTQKPQFKAKKEAVPQQPAAASSSAASTEKVRPVISRPRATTVSGSKTSLFAAEPTNPAGTSTGLTIEIPSPGFSRQRSPSDPTFERRLNLSTVDNSDMAILSQGLRECFTALGRDLMAASLIRILDEYSIQKSVTIQDYKNLILRAADWLTQEYPPKTFLERTTEEIKARVSNLPDKIYRSFVPVSYPSPDYKPLKPCEARMDFLKEPSSCTKPAKIGDYQYNSAIEKAWEQIENFEGLRKSRRLALN